MRLNTVKVDQVLEQLALENKSRFNAYFVAHLSEQKDVDRVNDYLMMKSDFSDLIVKVETICPESHIDQQFDLHKLPDFEIECRFCDDEWYIPDPENTNIVYFFSKEYVEEVKKERRTRV
ncbi:hypothetical protein HPL003_14250 [Paenibacillus terrae HPL-003]|uniref:Uncharacterized protein n=1 Tax=Paenibacillus terrae (strain HPL-003) TaxID=985665 RepID=G7W0I0_PAETH|nr:hypothetical protein [Paenibacillus terrae]AET59601.1 hypothetical protein HPL003_14250 [Paenibacillus terrae HPL-003]